jgi:acyl-CoA synthetase (AMP-forming)/AMP-acid ligase II
MFTCFEVFSATASRYPHNAFMHIPAQATKEYATGPVELTYQEAFHAIEGLQKTYRDKNYTQGTRIALILDNRVDFFLHFLALNSLGVSVVPVNSQFSIEEMAYLIGHSEARAVVVLTVHIKKAAAASHTLTAPVPVIPVDELGSLPGLRNSSGKQDIRMDTEAAILYTSGTTGKPKGCVLSNRYFISWGEWYQSLGHLASLTPGAERLITPLPAHHQNAMACSFMGMVHSGGCIIQLDSFHSSTWWDSVRDSKATVLHYLGVMPAMLLNMPEQANENFSKQIKFGLGAGVDPKHHARFEARFGFPLLEGWAMTETGGTACLMSIKEPRHVGQRCLGKAPAFFDYRIVDDRGLDVTPGEPGELLVRTKGNIPTLNFFSEYYKNPEATAEAWEGGYFHTGDVLRVYAEGYFYFVDRRKNVIRRSGENISAVEVEGALLQHPALAGCAVTAVQDEFRGEEVLALIILKPGTLPTEKTAQDILQFALSALSYYKAPGHIVFVDQLPIGATQKVKRGEIKQICNEMMNTPRHFDLCTLKKRTKSRVE